MELEAAKMIGAGLAAIALGRSWCRHWAYFWKLFIWCDEKSIGSTKTISKFTFRICLSRSYWFIWFSSCINNFICILKDKILNYEKFLLCLMHCLISLLYPSLFWI